MSQLEYPGWLADAVILRIRRASDGQRQVDELPAVNHGRSNFKISSTGKYVTACKMPGPDPVPGPAVRPLQTIYLPVHANCITIAKRVISSHTAETEAQSKLLKHFYAVLEARYEATARHAIVPMDSMTSIHEPNHYYGAANFHGKTWNSGSYPERRFEVMHYEADPIDVPYYMTSILKGLLPLPQSPAQGEMSFRYDLPPELAIPIMEHLKPFSDAPLTCTYIVLPMHWRRVLLSGTLLPWLWDLDQASDIWALNYEHFSQVPFATGGDWESLARLLAQVEVYEPFGLLEGLPLGLKNRRRIWRLVEDALSKKR